MARVTRKNSPGHLEHKMIVGGLKGITAWSELVAQRARENAPVDTYFLSPSIHADEPEENELVFRNIVGTNVEYARAHELGSGIHALDPAERELILIEAGFWTGKSEKKALAFHWPDGPKDLPNYDPATDKFIFRRVYHPGVRPAHGGKGYLRKALEETREDGRNLFLSALLAEMIKT